MWAQPQEISPKKLQDLGTVKFFFPTNSMPPYNPNVTCKSTTGKGGLIKHLLKYYVVTFDNNKRQGNSFQIKNIKLRMVELPWRVAYVITSSLLAPIMPHLHWLHCSACLQLHPFFLSHLVCLICPDHITLLAHNHILPFCPTHALFTPTTLSCSLSLLMLLLWM